MKIVDKINRYLVNEEVGKKEFYWVNDFNDKDYEPIQYTNPNDLKNKLTNMFEDESNEEILDAVKFILSAVSRGKKVYVTDDPYNSDVDDESRIMYDDDIKALEKYHQDRLDDI